MARDEVETAYFTLLRARDEAAGLRRYEEYLRAEQQRLRRGRSEAEALRDSLEARQRRPLRPTWQRLVEAEEEHLRLVADELDRLPDRIAAADGYVEECEHEHATLRGAR